MTRKWPKGFDQNVIQFKREEMAKSVSIANATQFTIQTQTHIHSSIILHFGGLCLLLVSA